jgi:aspartate/glutamate racemase
VKTIGLLGGMSWESTVPYCQTINRVVGERLGGLHSARIVLYTAERITAAGLRRVGLVATKFTMEDEFYRGRLESRHGLEVLVPPAEDRAIVHRIIYEELCLGRVLEGSRAQFRRIMDAEAAARYALSA